MEWSPCTHSCTESSVEYAQALYKRAKTDVFIVHFLLTFEENIKHISQERGGGAVPPFGCFLIPLLRCG